MKKVEVVNLEGYNPGEIIDMVDTAADTYARNGQVKPVGWSLDDVSTEEPVNRMMDTSGKSRATRHSRARNLALNTDE